MAMIIDTPESSPGPIWVFIAAVVLILTLSIKEWRRRARERRWKAWENRNTA